MRFLEILELILGWFDCTYIWLHIWDECVILWDFPQNFPFFTEHPLISMHIWDECVPAQLYLKQQNENFYLMQSIHGQGRLKQMSMSELLSSCELDFLQNVFSTIQNYL